MKCPSRTGRSVASRRLPEPTFAGDEYTAKATIVSTVPLTFTLQDDGDNAFTQAAEAAKAAFTLDSESRLPSGHVAYVAIEELERVTP